MLHLYIQGSAWYLYTKRVFRNTIYSKFLLPNIVWCNINMKMAKPHWTAISINFQVTARGVKYFCIKIQYIRVYRIHQNLNHHFVGSFEHYIHWTWLISQWLTIQNNFACWYCKEILGLDFAALYTEAVVRLGQSRSGAHGAVLVPPA